MCSYMHVLFYSNIKEILHVLRRSFAEIIYCLIGVVRYDVRRVPLKKSDPQGIFDVLKETV